MRQRAGDAARFEDDAGHPPGEVEGAAVSGRPGGGCRPRRAGWRPCGSAPSELGGELADQAGHALAVGPRREGHRMRCLSTGSANAFTSATEGRRGPRSGRGRAPPASSAWLARGPGPHRSFFRHRRIAPPRGGRAHEVVGSHPPPHRPRQAAHEALGREQLLGAHHRLRPGVFRRRSSRSGCGARRHDRIADVDLQEEAGRAVPRAAGRCLLLDRVRVASTWNGRGRSWRSTATETKCSCIAWSRGRLRARAGAVDLVGHQQLREDRALHETERAAALGILVEDFGAEDVGRHQIGG